MFGWIGGLVDRVFAVAGALTFSQIPLFMQQYQQHLAGHVAELRSQVEAMKNSAALTGKSLQQYVIKFLSSEDIDFKNQGDLMNSMIQRYDKLNEGYQALQHATIYSKPITFIKYMDWDIGRSTWNSFEVGFSFSMEGASYAIVGLMLGLLLFWLLSKIFKGIFTPIFGIFKT